MNEKPADSDWSDARGKKWLGNISAMEATLKPIDEPLIDALSLNKPCRIAEVGCGGGGTTLEILGRAPAGSVVHGYDLSPVLVEYARSRQPDAQAVSFNLADMGTAVPPVPAYDRLTSRFGVMFFNDPPGAFSNLFHWLAPGGRFAFAVWGDPSKNLWVSTVRQAVAEVIDLPPLDLEGPGPFRYSDASKFLTLLGQSGFAELEVKNWQGLLAIGGGMASKQAAEFAIASYSSFSELLAEAGGVALEEAQRLVAARYADFELNGAVRMDAYVHIVTGRRP